MRFDDKNEDCHPLLEWKGKSLWKYFSNAHSADLLEDPDGALRKCCLSRTAVSRACVYMCTGEEEEAVEGEYVLKCL